MKAADISDTAALGAVSDIKQQTGTWANTDQVAAYFPAFPIKVVHAKLRRLLKRGLVSGCPCGCRGDWEVVPRTKPRHSDTEPLPSKDT